MAGLGSSAAPCGHRTGHGTGRASAAGPRKPLAGADHRDGLFPREVRVPQTVLLDFQMPAPLSASKPIVFNCFPGSVSGPSIPPATQARNECSSLTLRGSSRIHLKIRGGFLVLCPICQQIPDSAPNGHGSSPFSPPRPHSDLNHQYARPPKHGGALNQSSGSSPAASKEPK